MQNVVGDPCKWSEVLGTWVSASDARRYLQQAGAEKVKIRDAKIQLPLGEYHLEEIIKEMNRILEKMEGAQRF